MAPKSTCGGVLRRIRPLAGLYRYYPYVTGTVSTKEDMKQEVVQLGVEFSLYVVESMFLLCDNIYSMLHFCFHLWREVMPDPNPILERLLRVIHHVYFKHIKPKNGVFRDDGNSLHWELIRTTWEDFAAGIIVLHRLDMALRRKVISCDDRLLPSAIAKYKQQVLKKLEYKLRSAKDVSEANGFAREAIQSNIFDLWKSHFDEEPISKAIKASILSYLFTPLFRKPVPSQKLALPTSSPFILGKDFAMEELKEEVVRLGVELSTYVVQSMFLLCDDIHTMLGFCYKLWTCVIPDQNPVLDRLLCVIHSVYSKYIKPKNGVYQDSGNSVHWVLIKTTWKDFADGIIILHRLDLVFREKASSFDDRQLFSAIEKYKLDVLKNLEDKLRSGSKVNGFAREMIEPEIFDLWKSLFDEEATSEVTRITMLSDLFPPLPLPSEMLALPVSSPYILGKDFVLEEMKEEVVRLGVELSLYVAESMFLLCDDIRSMLLFCYWLWRGAKRGVLNDNHAVDRLLLVMHYVYTQDIKPKNGVYQNDGRNSVQWEVVGRVRDRLAYGFSDVDFIVNFLKGRGRCGRGQTSLIERGVKRVEERLWCVKGVAEANGFARDEIERNILDLWASIFDEPAKEAKLTLEGINREIRRDLFLPLSVEGIVP